MRKNARTFHLSFDNLDRRDVPSTILVGHLTNSHPPVHSSGAIHGGSHASTYVKVYAAPGAGSSETTTAPNSPGSTTPAPAPSDPGSSSGSSSS